MVDLNRLARDITLKEGKKVSLPIGQVKEVMRLVLEELAEMNGKDLFELMQRYRK